MANLGSEPGRRGRALGLELARDFAEAPPGLRVPAQLRQLLGLPLGAAAMCEQKRADSTFGCS